jgi:hypothetical protein
MGTPESSVRRKTVAHLQSVPNLWFAPVVGTRFGKRGTPDIIGCYLGTFFWIETKAPKGVATPLQKHVHRLIQKAGGFGCVADSVDTVKLMLGYIEAHHKGSVNHG